MSGEPDRGGETAGDPPAPVTAGPGTAGSWKRASETGWRVRLPTFEGPLDLLLHLIQQNEIDIRDIPISFITEKYVEYITLMQELNIDVASEYLVMAATLAHIKSKMLLPTPPEDQEDASAEDEIDPRGELVRRLLEYQKYKQAAGQLGARSVLGRDVFLRGVAAPSVDGPSPLAPLSLFKLLDAFQSVLDRARINVDHEIDLERFSITDRINELSDVLRQRPRLRFDELFEGARSRGDLIITFLALLEMTRLRLTRLSQDAPFEPILVELAVSEETEPAGAGAQEAGAALYAGAMTGVDAGVPAEDASAETARAPRPPDAVEVSATDTRDEPPGTEPD